MANSDGFFNNLAESINKFNPSAVQAAPSASEPTTFEKIEELKKLEQKGHITSEKCEEMIDKLLR